MKSIRNFGTLAAPLALLLAVACNSESTDSDGGGGAGGEDGGGEDLTAEPGPTDVDGNVEIFSWWTSGGEQDALEALLEVHAARAPNANVTNAAVAFADKARDQLQERMEEALPPDTFQANIGADLFKWVLFNDVDDSAAKVESLQGMAEDYGWLEAFDPSVLDAASFDGKVYGVPVNVHRINSLFYRKDLFEQYGLEPPTTLEELHAVCEEIQNNPDIQAEGEDGTVSCMALGNQWNWTMSLVVFEMILPSIGGPAYYESFWRGEEASDDPEIVDTLNEALYLYCGGTDTSDCMATSYFNSDVDTVDWADALQLMVNGNAMMAPMGDWAKGLLEAEGLVPNEDFGVVAFPGSDGTFVFTSDTFPLPKGAPNRDGAVELLRTFASKAGQVAFNRKKGSIPARTDIDPTEFDELTQGIIQEFKDSEKVKALSGLIPGDVMPDLSTELKASLQAGSTEIITNYVEANYASLSE